MSTTTKLRIDFSTASFLRSTSLPTIPLARVSLTLATLSPSASLKTNVWTPVSNSGLGNSEGHLSTFDKIFFSETFSGNSLGRVLVTFTTIFPLLSSATTSNFLSGKLVLTKSAKKARSFS